MFLSWVVVSALGVVYAHARLVGNSGSSRGSYRLVCARVGVSAWVVCLCLGWLRTGCVVLYAGGWRQCTVNWVGCQ